MPPLIASWLCPPLALVVYAFAVVEARRMEATGQGWEMAFYFTPLVRVLIITVLLLGVCFAVVEFALRLSKTRHLWIGAAMVANMTPLAFWLAFTGNWC